MLNARANIAAREGWTEQPRPFPFAVTWFSLTAQLQPVEIREAAPVAPVPEKALAVAASVHFPMAAPPPVSDGRWEMVVPKMVRTGPRTFARVDPAPEQTLADTRPPQAPAAYLPPPKFANFSAERLLSKAFSRIGRRTRALLAAPAGEAEDRRTEREIWLSRITKSLRNRTADKEGER